MSATMKKGLAVGLCLAAATAVPALAAPDADVARLQAQLAVLQGDPSLGRLAVYEQMEARQAIAALDKARRSERADALYLAGRRVEIAELAARVQAARSELSRLDLQRSELLLEASRRDAARARQRTSACACRPRSRPRRPSACAWLRRPRPSCGPRSRRRWARPPAARPRS